MEFGIEKWAMLMMKNGKRRMTKVIELLNQGKIRLLEEQDIYKHLGI